MVRPTSRLAAALLAILIAASGAALAADKWQKLRSAEDGFEAAFPGKPKFTSQEVKSNGAMQHGWAYDIGAAESYQIVVIAYKRGLLPAKPDAAFYKRLADAYAGGAKCKLRSESPATVAGHAGVEAVCDGDEGDLHHLIAVTAVRDRIYVIASAGPGAHPSGAMAKRFRNSFRFIER